MESDAQKRLLTAMALSFMVLFAYMYFFAPKPEMQPPEAPVLDAGIAGVPPTPAPPVRQEEVDAGAAPASAGARLVELEREREQLRYRFSSEGASLRSAELKGPRMKEQPHLGFAEGFAHAFGKEIAPEPQIDMARGAGAPFPLDISISGSSPFPQGLRYAVEESEGNLLRFRVVEAGWEVVKTLEWKPEGFLLGYTLAITNRGPEPRAGELELHLSRGVDPSREEAPSFFGGIGNQTHVVCGVGEDFHTVAPSDKPPEEFKGPLGFAGVDQQYFLSALFPAEPMEGRCVLKAAAKSREALVAIPVKLAPGETVVRRFGVYIGPKDVEVLSAATAAKLPGAAADATFSPRLERSVDFGMWAVICKVLLAVMKFFYGVFGNWGVAVISLTVVVKLVLLPLTHKSLVSAEQMKALQPRMEEIRKKFADDKERQNTEIFKLYQEAKVNPLGGCLPILFQMPVWIALFQTLRSSYELYGEPFISPIWADLTYKDPTYILPVALGVTMVVTQMLQPQMMDKSQAVMMTYVMPVFFGAMMLQYPAGLTLYIFTNNVLSIGQQWALKRFLARKKPGREEAKK